jgi:membrane associated rhomboid family serine protease
VPGNTIRCPWNLLTSSFIEPSEFSLIFALGVLFTTAAVAEPIYGSVEFAKLIGVAALSSGVACFLLQYILFILTRRGSVLFSAVGGFWGVEGALLVAVKHVLPGQEVHMLPGMPIGTRYLPGIYLLLCVIWSMIAGNIALLRCAIQSGPVRR